MSNYHDNFAKNGGGTFTLRSPIDAFVSEGKPKPTNSYYGNSQVFRPTYEKKSIPAGTKLHSLPGGDWFEIDGKLLSFSLDSRNPNDVGTFEKHFDPTRYMLVKLLDTGALSPCEPLNTAAFNALYAKWRKVAG